jgi:hypothetical protein
MRVLFLGTGVVASSAGGGGGKNVTMIPRLFSAISQDRWKEEGLESQWCSQESHHNEIIKSATYPSELGQSVMHIPK